MPQLPSDPFFQNQWHLLNVGQTGGTPGEDLNVVPVWAEYSGRGVNVGVFDSGVQWAHPDLDDNYTFVRDLTDLRIRDNPARTGNGLDLTVDTSHGTNSAGVIAAEWNGLGTVGVAWGATVTSRGSGGTAAQLAVHDVNNFSVDWGFQVYMLRPFRGSASDGRDGLGTVNVVSSGNYRESGLDSGALYSQTSPYVMAVGASDHNGRIIDFSSPSSHLHVVAPSNGSIVEGIWTTDLLGEDGLNDGPFGQPWNDNPDYTSDYGGTSASAPMVSGVVALMLEANPDLGWRDVQTILAATARHGGSDIGAAPEGFELHRWGFNSATHWNGGGMHFSNDYGFGIVDALAAVRLAESWHLQSTSATLLNKRVGEVWTGEAALPPAAEGEDDGLTLTFRTRQALEIERVTLDLTLDVAAPIRVWLISPDGTEVSVYTDYHGLTQLHILSPNAFRGEGTDGIWSLRIEALGDSPAMVTHAALRVLGAAATDDDVLIYTNEFSDYAGATHSTLVGDGLGRDTVNAAAVSAATVLDLTKLTGRIDGVAVTISGSVVDLVSGDGADRLVGDEQGQWLFSGRGDDTLRGMDGDDRILAGSGDDRARGGDGHDVIDAGQGDDRLGGGTGDDTLVGGDGTDTLLGHEGADRLEDGAGTDILTGGAGADVFVLAADGVRDVITDFDARFDLIDLTAAAVSRFGDLVFANLADGVWEIRYGTETLRLTGLSDAQVWNADSFLFA